LAAADRIVGLRRYGGVLIIQVRLGDLGVRFLVDTGCAVTTLTPEAVERFRLDRNLFTGRRILFTAAGTSVAVPAGRIPSLRLGSVELRNIEVALLDLPAGIHVDDLLGVNVLDRFRATFEFRRATLVLRPDPAR
jgi:clan AA aspartic protease (TIGR02281 family)